jgi:hypothetical protein
MMVCVAGKRGHPALSGMYRSPGVILLSTVTAKHSLAYSSTMFNILKALSSWVRADIRSQLHT